MAPRAPKFRTAPRQNTRARCTCSHWGGPSRCYHYKATLAMHKNIENLLLFCGMGPSNGWFGFLILPQLTYQCPHRPSEIAPRPNPPTRNFSVCLRLCSHRISHSEIKSRPISWLKTIQLKKTNPQLQYSILIVGMSETLLSILTSERWCQDLGPTSWMEFKADGTGKVSLLYSVQDLILQHS